jgi:hypothetical protein
MRISVHSAKTSIGTAGDMWCPKLVESYFADPEIFPKKALILMI